MKASFISILAALASSFHATCALPATDVDTRDVAVKLTPPPKGLANGVYVGDIDKDGKTTWTFVAPLNTTAPAITERDAESSIEKRQGAYGVHCLGSPWVSSPDRYNAILAFSNICGGGYSFTAGIYIQSNSAVAYGCNYRSSATTCYYQSTLDRLNDVSNSCGWNSPGWFSLGQGVVSYGYTAYGNGFCW